MSTGDFIDFETQQSQPPKTRVIYDDGSTANPVHPIPDRLNTFKSPQKKTQDRFPTLPRKKTGSVRAAKLCFHLFTARMAARAATAAAAARIAHRIRVVAANLVQQYPQRYLGHFLQLHFLTQHSFLL
jgi:hypothetical protein